VALFNPTLARQDLISHALQDYIACRSKSKYSMKIPVTVPIPNRKLDQSTDVLTTEHGRQATVCCCYPIPKHLISYCRAIYDRSRASYLSIMRHGSFRQRNQLRLTGNV
jgi:hypothetical protein